MTNSLKNHNAHIPPPRPAAPFVGAENQANSGFSGNGTGSSQQNESRSQQVNAWKTRGVCSADVRPDYRGLSRDLRAKVINDPAVPLDLRMVSLRAACALQMMSDRNFEKAPAKVKADCRTALSDCMSAWAEHGAQEV